MLRGTPGEGYVRLVGNEGPEDAPMEDLRPFPDGVRGLLGADVAATGAAATASDTAAASLSAAESGAGGSVLRYVRTEQSAAAAGNAAPRKAFAYESAALDVSECSESRAAYARKSRGDLVRFYMLRWAVVVAIGLVGAMAGLFVQEGTRWMHKFTNFASTKALGDDSSAGDRVGAAAVFIVVSTLYALGAAMVVFLFDPTSRGAFTEIFCYLNGIVVEKTLQFRNFLTHMVTMTLSTGGALFVGKEGPMLAIGGQIGHACAKAIGGGRFDEAEMRNFVSCGLGAGIACAFGAPAGAVLFVLEKGFHFSMGLLRRLFTAAMITSIGLSLFIDGIDKDRWGEFLPSGLCHFGAFPSGTFTLSDLLVFGLLGAVFGALGALFILINLLSIRLRKKLFPSAKFKVFEVALLGFLTSLISIAITMGVGNCVDIPEESESSLTNTEIEYSSLFCPEGKYNDIGTLLLTGQETAMRFLFHESNHISFGVLACFTPVFFFISAYSIGCAVPSGFFMPALLIGSVIGRATGQAVNTASQLNIDAGVYALLGAGAMLSGVSRMTVSLAVILCEATVSTTYMLPLMLTMLVARWVGDLFTPSITEVHTKLKDYPLLEWSPPKSMRKFTAEQIMAKPVVVLHRKESIDRIREVLSDTTHHGFPVTDGETGVLLGLLTREKAMVLSNSNNGSTVLDLLPYSMHVLSVPKEISCIRVFNIFRTLGLRHLIVCSDSNTPIGIITRKDLYFLNESVHRNDHSRIQASLSQRVTSLLYGHNAHH